MANNFDPSGVTNLIGLWDFREGNEAADTGLGDGIAQNGTFENGAFPAGDALQLDGTDDFFRVEGTDAPFDLDRGTIEFSFSRDAANPGTTVETLVNRGEEADAATEGFFNATVNPDGSIQVIHTANGVSATVSTTAGFMSTPQDEVVVTYEWDTDTGGELSVWNLQTGERQTITHTQTGLDMDIGDNDNESFTFGARESDDAVYDQHFHGEMGYVAIWTDDPGTGGLDYIVEGTAGDDIIDVAYTGDPEGDMVDNGDALDGSDDDVILGFGGNDTIDAGEGDDDVDGGTGDDTIDGGAGDDILAGGEGSDEIIGGEGADEISGGAGGDGLFGDGGDDTIDGGAGSDDIDGGDGTDTIRGGTGDDVITGGTGADAMFGDDDRDAFIGGNDGDFVDGGEGGVDEDTLDLRGLGAVNIIRTANPENGTIEFLDGSGGVTGTMEFRNIETILTDGGGLNYIVEGTGGADLIDAAYTGDPEGDMVDNGDALDGSDDDRILGFGGDDTIIAGAGDDDVEGGAGNDTIFGNAGDDTLDGGDGADIIEGGSGADTITGGEGNDDLDGTTGDDIIDGGAGNDTIDGGQDNDTVTGGSGNDTITGGGGDDDLDGGTGRDNIRGNSGDDTIDGGEGDDVLRGDRGEDIIAGGAGSDTITGNQDDDTIDGGDGRDFIDGGSGADTLRGGNDQDRFTASDRGDMIGDTVDGGAGPLATDSDVLDLRGSATAGGSLNVTITGPDSNGNGFDGFVEYFDGAGASLGTTTFTEIEEIVPCFTPGTLIATPRGERLVEELREGDKIITRDNGIQEIRWVGAKRLDWKELNANPHLRPVMIKAGSLGHGLPERDMLVSPNHRMLVANDKTALYFEEREVLAAAKHLTGAEGISNVETLGATYIHFMFDQHEVVLSNGAWTESFQPGDYTLGGLGNAQRTEIFELFPELQTAEGIEDYTAARKTLKKHEARLLMAK